MTRDIPYTSDDLRAIADKIDAVLDILGNDDFPEDDWRWGVTVDIMLDNSGEYVVGQIRAHGDGWLGFYPQEIR